MIEDAPTLNALADRVERAEGPDRSILLPGQRCKIHGYRDARQRTRENEYLTEVKP